MWPTSITRIAGRDPHQGRDADGAAVRIDDRIGIRIVEFGAFRHPGGERRGVGEGAVAPGTSTASASPRTASQRSAPCRAASSFSTRPKRPSAPPARAAAPASCRPARRPAGRSPARMLMTLRSLHRPEERVELGTRAPRPRSRRTSLLRDLLGGADEAAPRRARERAADADAPHAERRDSPSTVSGSACRSGG